MVLYNYQEMSSSAVSTPAVSSSSERFTGRVKWFNNKAGYGFITVTDGPKSGTDVFVHHSSIKVDSEQYKYLVQGEYVDFSLSDTKTQDHEFQAGEVCGIKGGKLMCETRRDSRAARSQYRSTKSEPETSEPVKMPRSVAAPKEQKSQRPSRARGEGPREEGGEWTYVAKARKSAEPSQSTSQTPRAQRASSGRGSGRAPRAGRGEGKSQSS
jgi:CspA family cold shock protein